MEKKLSVCSEIMEKEDVRVRIEIIVRDSSRRNYTTEIVVEFLQEEELVNIFEYLVYHRGELFEKPDAIPAVFESELKLLKESGTVIED